MCKDYQVITILGLGEMKRLKRAISVKIGKSKKLEKVYSCLIKINFIAFHWKERMHMTHPGKEDKDKKYYVIRSRSNSEGLLSSFFWVLENIKWAVDNDYIPYVDFANSNCQYHVDRIVNNTKNAWEYFFTQPNNLVNVKINEKKNVLLSGWYFRDKYQLEKVKSPGSVDWSYGDAYKLITIQPYINDMVNRIVDEKFKNRTTVGVFVRGTDYVALRPKAHFVQPTIEQVIKKIKSFKEKYIIDQIYVVTEDYEYFCKLKEEFGTQVFANDDNFVKNYNPNDWIASTFSDDPYERGLAYLIRIILLTKCEYLISSKANGSLFAELLRENSCIDEYWFDLGRY